MNKSDKANRIGWLFGFYGISTFVDKSEYYFIITYFLLSPTSNVLMLSLEQNFL